MVKQVVLMQSMEDSMLQEVDMPWRKLQPMESPYRSMVFWQEFTPVGGTCCNRLLLKGCAKWKGSMVEQLVKNSSSWEGPHDKAGK